MNDEDELLAVSKPARIERFQLDGALSWDGVVDASHAKAKELGFDKHHLTIDWDAVLKQWDVIVKESR